MKGFEVTEIVKEIKFEGDCDKFESKKVSREEFLLPM